MASFRHTTPVVDSVEAAGGNGQAVFPDTVQWRRAKMAWPPPANARLRVAHRESLISSEVSRQVVDGTIQADAKVFP